MKRFAVLALIVLLSACSTAPSEKGRVADSVAGAAARIDEAALLRMHPFAPVVAQLDANINTLQSTLRGGLSNAGTALAGSRTVMQAQLNNAAARARGIEIAPPARSRVQPPAVRDLAGDRGLAQYRAALQARMDRALALREAQLREKEATADYQFGRSHSGGVLRLQLRLRSPYLDQHERNSLLGQLNAIQRQENRTLAEQQARDADEIARYRGTLAADAARQLASMEEDLRAHAAAVRSIPQPRNTIVARAEAIPSRTNSAQTAAAFVQANEDLSARFTQLRDLNAGYVSSMRDEIVALRAERDRLISEMRAQIEAEADRIARDRGLGKVYNDRSHAGAADLTHDVAAALGTIRG